MASKSFTLTEPHEGEGTGACAKLCFCTGIIIFVGLLGFAAVFVYQMTYGKTCSSPELDENGLSNWTGSGSDSIVFACFPGYYLEGESSLETAKCLDGLWNPLPPACNSLPILLDCKVNNQSLTGNITMWQDSPDSPTHIYGLINYGKAVKPQGHVMEHVIISKKTCNVTHTLPQDLSELSHYQVEREENSTEEDFSSESEVKEKQKIIRVHFHSSELKAYKKTEVFFNIIFVDSRTTATLVSVHQNNLTLVQTNTDPVHSLNATWNWDKETRSFFGYDKPRYTKTE